MTDFDPKLYQTLLEVSEAISTHHDLPSLFRDLRRRLHAVVPYDGVIVLLYDEARDVVREYLLESDLGHTDDLPRELPAKETPGGWVCITQEPMFVTDPAKEERFQEMNQMVAAMGVQSYCVLPLTSAGRRLGAIGFASQQASVYDPKDHDFLMLVARQVAVAVDNTLNFESAREAQQRFARERDRLQLLLEINNAVVSTLDLQGLLKVISSCLRQVIPHDAALLTLHDPESAQLRLQALDLQMFGQVPFEEGVLISPEDTPEGQAITSRRPVLVGPVVDLTRFSSPWVRHAVDNGVRSGCAVPLISHDRPLGAMSVVSLSEDAFGEADVELLGQCASQIAIAVENALNFERARKVEQQAARERDRIKLLLEINNAVVSHLDLRDLVKTVSASLRDVMPHDAAGIALYDSNLNQLREYSNVFYKKDVDAFREGEAIPLEGTPAGQVFLAGQPLLIKRPDEAKYPGDRYSQRPVEGSPKSACLAPLTSHDKKLGIAGVSSTQEEAFTDEDLELFAQIADQIAIAVENSLNFERVREVEQELARKFNHLRLMLQITNAVVSQLDLRELLQVISISIREGMGIETAGVGLYDPERGELSAYATDFPSAPGFKIPFEGSPGGEAFTSGKPVFMDKPDLVRFHSDFSRLMFDSGYRSGGSIPLIAQGRKLGVLGVSSKREAAFSDEDKELLAQVANQVAIAIDNALNFERARKAEQQAKLQSDRLRLMLEITNTVVSQLDLRELLHVVSSSIREAMGNDSVGVGLFDHESGQLRVFASDYPPGHPLRETGVSLPLEGSPSGLAFTSGQPVFMDKPDLERFPSEIVKRVYESGYISGGSIPLIAQGRKLGVLGVASKRENALSPEDKELLTQVANQVAIAVDNALNFERARKAEQEVKRQFERLRLMLEVNNAIVSHLDLRELVRATAVCLREVLHHEIVGLSLYDPDTDQLRAYAYDVPDRQFSIEEGTLVPMEGSLGGMAFTSGQPVFVNRPRAEEEISDFNKRFTQLGVKSGGCVPLIVHGRKLGVLGVASFREDAFPDEQQDLLGQIAAQIAIAVDNALNFERARKAEQEVRRRFERERLMLEINNAVVSNLELPELLAAISAGLRRVLPHDFAGMALYDPELDVLRVQALDYTLNQELFGTTDLIPVKGTGAGVAFTSRKSLRVPRIDPKNSSIEVVRRIVAAGFKSSCHVPLISRDRALGTLDMLSFQEDAFSEEDVELLKQVANQVAIAVDNALNFERARKAEQEATLQSDRLSTVLQINNAVVSQLDLHELLQNVSRSLRRTVHNDTTGVALYDSESNKLRMVMTDFLEQMNLVEESYLIELEGSAMGQAFTSGEPVFMDQFDLERFPSDFTRRSYEAGLRSACNIPLIAHGRKLGALGVASKQPNAFSVGDKELLCQSANQIAIAVENALNYERTRAAEEEAKRQSARLQLMLEINNAVVSELSLRELLRVTSARLREALPHDVTGISLYDPETNQFRAYQFDLPNNLPPIEEGTTMPLEGTVGGLAFHSGRPIFLNQYDPDFLTSEFDRRLMDAGIRSGGVVPLIAHDKKLGFLGVGSFRENAFSDADQELLCNIANQISIAVENALNFERAHAAEEDAKQQSARRQLLLEINNAVVSHLDLRGLIQIISASLRQISHHDVVGLALYDPDINQLRAYAYDSLDKQFAVEEGTPIPLESSLSGAAFTTGQPIFHDRIDEQRFQSDFSERFRAAGLKSGGVVPLIAHGRKLGTLAVASYREANLTEDEKELLRQIASQVAIAVENALNFERARGAEEEAKRQSERRQLLLEINNAVVSKLDLRGLIKTISTCLRDFLKYDIVGLTVYDREADVLRAYAFDFPDGRPLIEDGQPVPLDGSVSGRAFSTGQPVLLGNVGLETFTSDFSRPFRDAGIKAGGAVPVVARGVKLGSLGVANFREGSFTEDDIVLLSQIANQIAVAVENALAFREIETLKNKLASEKLYLEDELRTQHNFEELIGDSQAFRRILKQVETVAPTGSTVLICGETGTGKELIARAIHDLSDRRERTLVKINCAAIPTGLLESELFGHEKGAFTGAISQRIGRFELAHRGSLFLDEVGDIPLELQPKLLRVLQEQEFERLGSTRTQKADARLIAATNCDLEKMVADRKYRSDLYYRLNVFPITIPPLRERREDIPALTRFFTQRYARRLKKHITAIPSDVMTAFTRYPWPGNVRELEHFIERAVILTRGSELEVSLAELKSSEPVATAELATLQDAERDHILRALEETNWVIGGPGGAAARLGMKRTTLQSRMQKLGISRQS